MPLVRWTVLMVAMAGCSPAASPIDVTEGSVNERQSPPPATATSTPPSTATEMAEHIRELVAADRVADVHALFDTGMQAKINAPDLRDLVASLVQAKGAWTSVEPGSASGDRGWFVIHAEQGDWRLELALDGDGKITGLLIRDHQPAPPVAKSELDMVLPITDTWLVFWGGPSKDLNHHLDHPSQRRAADLLMVDDAGKSFRGDGTSNRDYFAYGKDIVAVAAGRVAVVVDGVPDNTPGQLNPYMTTGNLVIIDHGKDVFSAYAHLIPGSIPARVGQKVARGQVIGKCGNSGNSSEAHLHFQLQDGIKFESSWGIEPVFRNVEVIRDGERTTVAEYTFMKGDQVIGK